VQKKQNDEQSTHIHTEGQGPWTETSRWADDTPQPDDEGMPCVRVSEDVIGGYHELKSLVESSRTQGRQARSTLWGTFKLRCGGLGVCRGDEIKTCSIGLCKDDNAGCTGTHIS
jgi:hypothetical protein